MKTDYMPIIHNLRYIVVIVKNNWRTLVILQFMQAWLIIVSVLADYRECILKSKTCVHF